MTENENDALNAAAFLIHTQRRTREQGGWWDVLAIRPTIRELLGAGEDLADVIAAGIRAARNPETAKAPTVATFLANWDREDQAYNDAVVSAKQTIRERSARVRACDRCDDHGYVGGRLCPHADIEVLAEQAHDRAERARAEIHTPDHHRARKQELVGEWRASADQQAKALRRLEAHIAEHPELAPTEATE